MGSVSDTFQMTQETSQAVKLVVNCVESWRQGSVGGLVVALAYPSNFDQKIAATYEEGLAVLLAWVVSVSVFVFAFVFLFVFFPVDFSALVFSS